MFIVLMCFKYHVQAQKTEQVKWLVNTWKITTPNGNIIEQWKFDNDSTLSGKSYFVTPKNDTVPQETLLLTYKNNNWVYKSKVVNQNNGKAIEFKVKFIKGTEFISENPLHDFPQRIAYRKIKNQLFASIEGNNKSKYSKQNFDFIGD